MACFGDGKESYVETLGKLAQQRGVAGRFRFAGSVPPDLIQEAIAGADAGIIAVQRGAISYNLALPSKLFECVFAGLPVVASDLVEIRTLVNEYGLGTLVDERSPEAIAKGMRALMDARERYRGEAWESRQKAFVDRFDWRVHKMVLLDEFERLGQS